MRILRTLVKYFSCFSLLTSVSVTAQEDKWNSITLDNDLFIGDDSGYSNGLRYSYYKSNDAGLVEPGLLNYSMLWSLDLTHVKASYKASTFGQSIVTPRDIRVSEEQPNDVPYSGLMSFTQILVIDHGNYADRVSSTLGIIGPNSGAENTQKVIHKLTGSDIPKGWKYQLGNEFVFQFSRGRAWRTWASQSDNFDLVTGYDLKIGTIESSVSWGGMMRYGRDMAMTYSSALLNDDRASNPVNINGGWFFYAGIEGRYMHNIIFLDGNTFKDSPSIDYPPFQFNGVFGFTYAWEEISISIAINNIDVFASSSNNEDIKEYGSFTLLWRL